MCFVVKKGYLINNWVVLVLIHVVRIRRFLIGILFRPAMILNIILIHIYRFVIHFLDLFIILHVTLVFSYINRSYSRYVMLFFILNFVQGI